MSKKVHLKVVPTEADYDSSKVLGRQMFPELYSNIYIAGRKKSGKTQLLYNILDRCANKSTKVMLFSATVNKDATYKEIIKMLDKKGIDHCEFEHFITEEKEDLLAAFIQQAKEENAEEVEQVVPPTSRKYVPIEEARILFGNELPKNVCDAKNAQEEAAKAEAVAKKKKKKKKGLLSPEYILCFDDLGDDLRKRAVSQLLIKNRHYKCKVIILSQWITYLPPTAIRQLDYALLFGGFADDKLEDLHLKLDLSVPFEEFEKIYRKATEKKYSFLTIDIAEQSYRTKFD